MARMADETAIQLARWEFGGLRIALGSHTLSVGRLVMQELVALLHAEGGAPRLQGLEAAHAQLDDVKFEGPIGAAAGAAWSLTPLATADGQLRAEIVDAHLMFDAQVTVPIGRGTVDFNAATVEHVGPDSRMGVSKMGLYVDAPNGRSYLYQFPATPVAGVAFERRGPLPGPWASDRGSLQLQPFVEALLRQGPVDAATAVTTQARSLLGRTAVGGEVQLGDGPFAVPGVRGELSGRTSGRNRLRLHSGAVGHGIALEMDALSLRTLALDLGARSITCDEAAGAFTLRLFLVDSQLRFELAAKSLRLTGLRLGS
jgi:hypothetical protein